MNNVLFNRESHKVVGLNRPASPFEYSVTLPHDIKPSKVVNRVDGLKHKKNAEGQLLYKDNIRTDEMGMEVFDEVTEAKKPTLFANRTYTHKITSEDGTEQTIETTVEEPIEWEDREPVMVDNVVMEQVTLRSAPREFTYEEVLETKKKAINENSLRSLVHYDEDFDLAGISDELASHSASMGDGIMCLDNFGQCRTEKIALGATVDTVEVYLEAMPDIAVEVGVNASTFVDVVDGIAKLPSATSEVYVRFKNTVDRKRDVYAFGILV